jgi:hypothetical protein
MQIQILSSILINGVWHEPGLGNYDPVFARQLIDMGVAVEVETKIVEPEVKKVRRPKKSSGVSQPAPRSRRKIAKGSEDTAK